MIEYKVDLHVAIGIIEQFENYRCYLFQPSINTDDVLLVENIVQKFHDNNDISGFFLDPSEDNSRIFIQKTLSALYTSTYLKDYSTYIK